VSSRFSQLGPLGPCRLAVGRAASTRARPPCGRCGAAALDRLLDRIVRDAISAASIRVARRMVLSVARRLSTVQRTCHRFDGTSGAELGGSRSELEIGPADDAGQPRGSCFASAREPAVRRSPASASGAAPAAFRSIAARLQARRRRVRDRRARQVERIRCADRRPARCNLLTLELGAGSCHQIVRRWISRSSWLSSHA